MSLVPQFIALKKGKECFAVQSWRDSPSVKPTSVSTPPPPMAMPGSTSGDESVKRRSRRGKNKNNDDGFEDFYVKCAGSTAGDIEQMLQHADMRPLRVMEIGAQRSISLKRAEDDTTNDEFSPLRSPFLCGAQGSDTERPGNGTGAESDNGGGGVPPEMTLPPSVPASVLETQSLVCLLFAELEQAEKAVAAIHAKWPSAATEIQPRKRAVLNSTLVIKGLPFTTKFEKLVEELEKLQHKPSYLRLLRSEHGVFKCVVFVKYGTRDAAEHSRLELERLVVRSKPLKVEFKKKCREQENSMKSTFAALEQAVRDLRASREHEGFTFQRASLSKEDLRYLKHLCVSFDFNVDAGAESVTVKRKLPHERASPALRPSCPPATPPWVPATPGALAPMDFRGIRHWKEVRQAGGGSSLGFIRPLAPGDVAPFGAGRGKPVQ